MTHEQRDQFVEAIRSGLKKVGEEKRGSSKEWTAAIKHCLLKIANEFELSSNCHLKSRKKYKNHDNKEWLYDVILYKSSDSSFNEIWLTVESEWSTDIDEIFWDFQKLLVAKSSVHLMIFDAPSGKYNEYLNEMKLFIDNSEICNNDEVFLFVSYIGEDNTEFKFEKHIKVTK